MRNQRGCPDGDRIRAQCQRLGDIGPIANAARHDKLHLAVHPQILQRLHRRADAGQRWLADVSR